jgi:geranylgeranyl diphosphate synthase, type II
MIFCCEAAGGKMIDALDASVAIEILHNFTLVHDDIMDNADTRRGRETIHKKWDPNTAILAGDYLIGIAYDFLLNTNSNRLKDILKTFTNGIKEVCEGQSYDKEFEKKPDVNIDEYLMMIGKKTAAMLEAAAVTGALIADADEKIILSFKMYARNLGFAFQIQDDLLDITGDETEFGKKIGGDLIEGKKTYLLLKALELVTEKKDREKLEFIILNNGIRNNNTSLIAEIKNIFTDYNIIQSAKDEIKSYTEKAEDQIQFLNTPESKVHYEKLMWLSQMLLSRNF